MKLGANKQELSHTGIAGAALVFLTSRLQGRRSSFKSATSFWERSYTYCTDDRNCVQRVFFRKQYLYLIVTDRFADEHEIYTQNMRRIFRVLFQNKLCSDLMIYILKLITRALHTHTGFSSYFFYNIIYKYGLLEP